MIAIEARIGALVEIGVQELSIDALQGQTPLPAVPDDFQDSFGVLHCAYLSVGKSE